MLDGLRNSASEALDKAKQVINRSGSQQECVEEQQPDRLEELSDLCPTLTYQQRILGFFASFSLGCEYYLY